MAILSKERKPNNFEPHNSLKLSFTNIRDRRSNFIACESFPESNSPDILLLCETNLDDLGDTLSLFVGSYLPLIWKDSVTHMHVLALYMKEGLPFAWDLSLENSAGSYLCFQPAWHHLSLPSFSSIDHLLHLYAWFLMLFHVT